MQNSKEHTGEWHKKLDALGEGRMSWEDFLQDFPLSEHPAGLFVITDSGHSLLHLAVMANRADLVEKIKDQLPQLKWRGNSFNWTPLELARFLPRKEIADLLQQTPLPLFINQPNVSMPEVGQFAHLQYLAQPLFESEEIFYDILEKNKKVKKEDAIPQEKIWMGIYFDKEIHLGKHPKVSIRFINEKVGFGVFAEQRIAACSFAGEYQGVVKEGKKKELKEKMFCVRYSAWKTGRKKYVLDAEEKGNFTRFINHSVRPNLSLQSVYWRGLPRMIFVALKEIPVGAQLTFDYGHFFWKKCSQTPVVFD